LYHIAWIYQTIPTTSKSSIL